MTLEPAPFPGCSRVIPGRLQSPSRPSAFPPSLCPSSHGTIPFPLPPSLFPPSDGNNSLCLHPSSFHLRGTIPSAFASIPISSIRWKQFRLLFCALHLMGTIPFPFPPSIPAPSVRWEHSGCTWKLFQSIPGGSRAKIPAVPVLPFPVIPPPWGSGAGAAFGHRGESEERAGICSFAQKIPKRSPRSAGVWLRCRGLGWKCQLRFGAAEADGCESSGGDSSAPHGPQGETVPVPPPRGHQRGGSAMSRSR